MTSPTTTTTRTLTLDDIFALDEISDAQISPDGTTIAFVAGRQYTEGERALPAAGIWAVAADGSAPARRLTSGPRSDTRPRWSPDGTALAFLSDRDQPDTPQVYVLPVGGGEARRLTDQKGGVSDLVWSPDGTRIAFLSADAESDEEKQRKEARDDAVHVDHEDKFTRVWVVDVAGGAARAITPPEYQVRACAWYQDGWAIVTSATPHEDDGIYPWPVRAVAADGTTRTLWQGAFSIELLAGSRDGQSLAWLHGGARGEDSADEVWVLTPGAAARCALADSAGGRAWAGWLPDGKALLIAAVDGTRTILGRLDLESGVVAPLLVGRTLGEGFTELRASVSGDGRRVACVLEDAAQPKEVYVIEASASPAEAAGSEPKRLTTFNRHLEGVALAEGETIEWSAPDGQTIQGVVLYPPGQEVGRTYPLIVHLHGGPGWYWLQRFMASWHDWGQWLAANGYAVLLPNPRGSGSRGREFMWSNRRNWGHGDLGDVLSGVDTLIARGLADPDRLAIGGWSYGGYLTSWAIGHNDRFKAAVVGAGVTDLLSFQAADIPSWLPGQMMLAQPYDDLDTYLRCSPILAAGQIATPTLVLHGAADERVRLGQGKELYHALKARGVPTEMVIYPREPHLFGELHHQRDLLRRVVAWYDRWLKPSRPAN